MERADDLFGSLMLGCDSPCYRTNRAQESDCEMNISGAENLFGDLNSQRQNSASPEPMRDAAFLSVDPRTPQHFDPMPEYYSAPVNDHVFSTSDVRIDDIPKLKLEENETLKDIVERGEEMRTPLRKFTDVNSQGGNDTPLTTFGESRGAKITLSLGKFNSICSEKTTPRVLQPTERLKRIRKGSFNEGEPRKPAPKCCNCKKSRCLKLYCECFASGQYCEGCNCIDCHNKEEFEPERSFAIRLVKYRNPLAVMRKTLSHETEVATIVPQARVRCNCTRSGCLNGYCECHKNGLKCGPLCNCINCKNAIGLSTFAPFENFQ